MTIRAYTNRHIIDGLRTAFVESGGAFSRIPSTALAAVVTDGLRGRHPGTTPAVLHDSGLALIAKAAGHPAEAVFAVAAGRAITPTPLAPDITREDADRYAARSFDRAMIARHFIAGEIIAVTTETTATYSITLPAGIRAVDSDSRLRATSYESLAAATPARNTAPLADGAAAILIGRPHGAPLARIHASATGTQLTAIPALLAAAHLTLDQIDRIELDETTAAGTLATARALGLDSAKLNVNGGAIALGHAPAATGLRLALSLARELHRSHTRWGLACDHDTAILLENEDPG